ncbi:MAG: hypothetical protein ACM3UU_11765 [Ignavibacteriales bacterium]
MKVIRVKESEIKSITEFLIKEQIIFHPVISPYGSPDFTNYLGRNYILLLDRNILTKFIELCNNGTLKEMYLLKVISSLIFWAEFNSISINAGLALNEYANHKQNNMEASKENNIFRQSSNYYSPEVWLDLATGKIKMIPKLNLTEEIKDYIFNIESEHYKMHYAEMLHITYLYFRDDLSQEEKVLEFIRWNNENILFCCYTIVYILLLFSNKLKRFATNGKGNIEYILKKCHNQAWDLTYLSVWSTFYWDERKGDTTYLFSTMDKDLKKIFINTHDVSSNIFVRFFGEIKGNIIQEEYAKIANNRVKPEITLEVIERLIESERNKLEELINR